MFPKKFTRLSLLFLLLLLVGIFYNLWKRPLFGVEGRWAEAAREMTLRGSWFVPTINFEPHVTKPLIPFWLIKISGELLGYSEFSVRLPGAILAFLSVILFYLLSRRFFDEKWAFLATVIYGVSIGFLQFARLAQSEIFQLFGIVAALTVYVYYREKSSFVGYILFILALLFGALSKGLTALSVLSLFVAIDILLYRRFYHFNIKAIFALILGVFLYFLPYYLTSRELQTELPFYLWFRENLKQAVDPYDNLRPFYIYFYFLPIWIAPFTLFFLANLFIYLKNLKTLTKEEKLYFLTNLSIFTLFTLAKARRGYYILPILPFTVIMMSFYLYKFKNGPLLRIYQILSYLLPLMIPLIFLFLKVKNYPLTPEIELALLAILIIQAFLIKNLIKENLYYQKLLLVALIFLSAEILYFSFLQPFYSSSTEKEAGLLVKALKKEKPQSKICSLSSEEKPVANIYFYAEISQKVEDFSDPKEAFSKNCKIIIVRKTLKEDWKVFLEERGFKLVPFEAKGDRSKSYYILYSP